MQFDIQTTIQDNLRLKKALQMSKFSYDKLQKQYKQLQSIYQQSLQRNKSLKDDYCQLQRKYQQSFTESVKDNNSLINQIEELKKIIENKQRQLQHIQIKLIPNLDQDMLRVKLITEMEGPYQQLVDKKDKQLQKFKQKVSQLQRKLQISNLSSKSIISQLKKQRDEIKQRYQQQNSRIMGELNISLSRNEQKSVQRSIMRNQKKQIQQLKVTLQFMNRNEQIYQQEMKNIKQQRNHLLQKLKFLNQKQALYLQGKFAKNQIQSLKQQKNKLMSELNRIKNDNQKYQRVKQKLQNEKYKIQSELEKQLTTERNKFSLERNQLNNQVYQLKQQIKKIKNIKFDTDNDKQAIIMQVHKLQKQLYQKSKQIQKLVMQSSNIITKQIHQPKNCWDNICPANKTNQIENQINLQNITKKTKINKNIIKNSQDQQTKTKEVTKIIDQVKNENQKLKKKLNQANKKIVQLLKDKMKNKSHIIQPQRDRTTSYIQKPRGVFLEYQDCAFEPLVEPTLYTYMQKTSKRLS